MIYQALDRQLSLVGSWSFHGICWQKRKHKNITSKSPSTVHVGPMASPFFMLTWPTAPIQKPFESVEVRVINLVPMFIWFCSFSLVCNKPAVRASGSGQTLFLHEHHPRSPSSLCRPSLSAKTQKQQPASLSESFVALRSSRLGGGPEGVTSLSGHECSRTSLTAVKTSPLQLFYKRARNTRPVIPDRFSPPRYRFYRYSSS